ncbi:hypothetical protein M404DRAFT_16790 [Pisolithus tinctorius Marx 270]|uniref:CxC2-like cysteine cluster KDZ transposase-associated domain-containing protein n=1 Tax=Pisolithus tinctorius Marx 270 TaxID=870435 RepID=A0A0C3NPM1_PISTI|nr:hypothetical protein M404DRAFT_16790 [Pisolithus tinctorius Marx 270]
MTIPRKKKKTYHVYCETFDESGHAFSHTVRFSDDYCCLVTTHDSPIQLWTTPNGPVDSFMEASDDWGNEDNYWDGDAYGVAPSRSVQQTQISEYLFEELQLESRGNAAKWCSCEVANCHGVTLSCQTCCLATHQCLPLHKIKKWNRKFFERVTLKQLGLIVQLGHEDMFCYCPEHGHLDFIIIDVNGIHPVNVNFCGCEQCMSHCQQLLQCGWYPATICNPRTACTRTVLDHFLQLMWSSKHLTDNTGINMPKSRCHPFLHMVCQFRHMKLLKRAGRASEQDGICTTKPGGLAVLCPACPQPGMNLPDDWKDAEPSKKFLYSLIIAIDANFWLKNHAHASDQDPGLHTSLAYFVADGPYNEHILWFAMQEDISMCNSFRSMAHAETKFATGLCTMGVGLCLYQLPEHLHLPLTVVVSSFVFGIPKFHAPAHSASCAIPHSLNLLPGVGRTDGEGVEHNWLEINHVANSTKEMTPGARHDTIDDHFGHHNFRKLVGLADKSKPNPYATTQCFPTKAEVFSQLAADDKAAAARGEFSCHKMSPSSFVSFRLAIEETQRSLKSDVSAELRLMFHKIQVVYMIGIKSIVQRSEDPEAKAKAIRLCMPSELSPAEQMSISDDISVIKAQLREAQCRDALGKLRNYLHMQTHFIKYRNTNICGQRANTHAKTLINTHSSKIGRVIQKYWVACAALLVLRGAGSWEEELWLLQMKDVCGPTASTSGDIDDPNAIIGSNGCQRSKKQCKALRHGLGEGYRTMSWIWACGTVASSDEGMIEALCIEWAKAHARAAHWSEEVELLLEEMWCTEKFLEYKAQWWKQHREPPSGVMVDRLVREGICAYADRQATLQHQLSDHFSMLWHRARTNVEVEDCTKFFSIDDDSNSSAYELGDSDLEDDNPNSSAYEVGDDDLEDDNPNGSAYEVGDNDLEGNGTDEE